MPPQDDQAMRGVLDVLALDTIDENTFQGRSLPQPRGRVYGGQVLAQALIAAARTVTSDRLPHSVHGYFLRPGDLAEPITFTVDRLHDGGSFSTRRSHALQGGKPILSMITSFQSDQLGVDHFEPMPTDVPEPEDLPSSLKLLRAADSPMAKHWVQYGAFDLRHSPRDIYAAPGPRATDRQYVWMRTRTPLPDSELLHRAMLIYGCDQILFEPALRRHGESWMTPGVKLASLDHAMWWHRPVRTDQWLLYVQLSPTAQGGRSLSQASVYTREGLLVATIAQEGMIRIPRSVGGGSVAS